MNNIFKNLNKVILKKYNVVQELWITINMHAAQASNLKNLNFVLIKSELRRIFNMHCEYIFYTKYR